MADAVPYKIRSPWPSLVLLLLAAGYTAWAQRYGDTARLMPTLVGGVTIMLTLLDLLSRLDNPVGRALAKTLGADFTDREMPHDPALGREAVQVGWMLLCIAALWLIGFLPTIPLFIAAYMRLAGGRPWLSSVLSGVVVLGFVALVFHVLLDYELYRGVLFEGGLW